MRISLTYRNVESSDALKEYVEQRFKKLKKYIDGPMDVNVVLSVEKFRQTAEVVMSGDGIRAAAKEVQEDMRAAIDLVSDKIEKQLKRYREKLRNKRTSGQAPHQPADDAPVTTEPEETVIQAEKMQAKPMSVEEAVAQLQLLDRDFIVFPNADTNQVNVVYWRKDGALGLIEP